MVDEHLIYALLLVGLLLLPAARRLSLSGPWLRIPLVRRSAALH